MLDVRRVERLARIEEHSRTPPHDPGQAVIVHAPANVVAHESPIHRHDELDDTGQAIGGCAHNVHETRAEPFLSPAKILGDARGVDREANARHRQSLGIAGHAPTGPAASPSTKRLPDPTRSATEPAVPTPPVPATEIGAPHDTSAPPFVDTHA